MAVPEQEKIINQGAAAWNAWRQDHPDDKVRLSGIRPYHAKLAGADLHGADLHLSKLDYADLSGANLEGADLGRSNLKSAILEGANLREASLIMVDLAFARLRGADLYFTNAAEVKAVSADFTRASMHGFMAWNSNLHSARLTRADLTKALLSEANFWKADLSGADLREADLRGASLRGTKVEGANISGCKVHGINAWDLAGEFAAQQGLVITPDGEPGPVVDSLQHAGLVYWAMQRLKARGVEPAAAELEARLIAALEDLFP